MFVASVCEAVLTTDGLRCTTGHFYVGLEMTSILGSSNASTLAVAQVAVRMMARRAVRPRPTIPTAHQGAPMNVTPRGAFRAAAGVVLALALAFAPALRAEDGKIEILWLGQSATRIKTVTGKVIVVDPWLINNPKTPQQYKDLDALGKVDLILVTHAHADHFEDAPALAKKNNAKIVSPAGLQSTMISLGMVPAELAYRMNKSGTAAPIGGNIKITQVHAEHDSELTWTNPETKKRETHFGGEPVGYIIELENGFKIYHMGDTGVFGDMKFIGEFYKPDLIMIPIGGHFVLGPKEAALVTREYLKPKYAIPIHYATNPFLVGTPAQYMEALGTTSTKVFPINPGDKLEF
jgi:L-ascorbate metabolism protein UlaG (beta-lactamase superfamily)